MGDDGAMRIRLLVAIVLAGCAAAGAPERALTGSEWELTSLRGEPPAGKSRITLRFDAGSAGGYGGCNWYGGEYALSGNEIAWKEMSSTLRACMDGALTDQEARYLEALRTVARYRVEGDRLVLSDAAGNALVELERRVLLSMDPRALVGTRWRLLSIDGAPPAGGAPLTIAFPQEGTIRGFAGCRAFVSRYRAEGDRIDVSETHMDGTECDAPRTIAVQEGDFTTHLSEAEHYRLAGDRLEMTTAGGVVLVFARMDDPDTDDA